MGVFGVPSKFSLFGEIGNPTNGPEGSTGMKTPSCPVAWSCTTLVDRVMQLLYVWDCDGFEMTCGLDIWRGVLPQPCNDIDKGGIHSLEKKNIFVAVTTDSGSGPSCCAINSFV